MLLLVSVEPERWYTVKEVEAILGWDVDTIRRWIHRKLMAAFVLPSLENRRKRKYQCLRIQGCEIIRFVKAHLTSSKP
jgi:hypothetical protein